MSGIIATKINRQMVQYMSRAQKSLYRNNREAKHQLTVDRPVTQDCETRLTNLCIAWIDKKPHTWILECLELYNCNKTLTTFIWK